MSCDLHQKAKDIEKKQYNPLITNTMQCIYGELYNNMQSQRTESYKKKYDSEWWDRDRKKEIKDIYLHDALDHTKVSDKVRSFDHFPKAHERRSSRENTHTHTRIKFTQKALGFEQFSNQRNLSNRNHQRTQMSANDCARASSVCVCVREYNRFLTNFIVVS